MATTDMMNPMEHTPLNFTESGKPAGPLRPSRRRAFRAAARAPRGSTSQDLRDRRAAYRDGHAGRCRRRHRSQPLGVLAAAWRPRLEHRPSLTRDEEGSSRILRRRFPHEGGGRRRMPLHRPFAARARCSPARARSRQGSAPPVGCASARASILVASCGQSLRCSTFATSSGSPSSSSAANHPSLWPPCGPHRTMGRQATCCCFTSQVSSVEGESGKEVLFCALAQARVLGTLLRRLRRRELARAQNGGSLPSPLSVGCTSQRQRGVCAPCRCEGRGWENVASCTRARSVTCLIRTVALLVQAMYTSTCLQRADSPNGWKTPC